MCKVKVDQQDFVIYKYNVQFENNWYLVYCCQVGAYD